MFIQPAAIMAPPRLPRFGPGGTTTPGVGNSRPAENIHSVYAIPTRPFVAGSASNCAA